MTNTSTRQERSDRRNPEDPVGPRSYDDAELVAYLGDVQARARFLMQEYEISTAHISVMARRAEQTIEDMTVRAEFLRLLIDLHEFGREVLHRGLAAQVPSDATSDDPVRGDIDRGTKLLAPTEGAADSVSDKASRDFFAGLDR